MAYQPATVARLHQTTALTKIAGHPGRSDAFGLLMEMGTGKSKVIVDEWGYRTYDKDVSDLLIWAPAGCYRNWTDDSGPEELGELHKHLDPELYERAVIYPWKSGAGVGEKNILRQFLATTDRPRVFVVNIEAMSAVEKAREACLEFIRSSKRGVIIVVDESTIIKNKDANCTIALMEIAEEAKVAAKRIMTGLVTPNSPIDLFSQFKFLDWRILGFNTFVGFRSRYAITRRIQVTPKGMTKAGKPRQPRMIDLIVGFRNVEELHGMIEPQSFRVLKKDCLDLPPKIYMPLRDVELTPEQKRIYREVRDHATSQLKGESYVTVTMVLTMRVRLDQVLCGFTMDESNVLHEIPERRTAGLLDILEDYEGKAIIWTTHDYCLRKISATLAKKYGPETVAQFWGGNRKTRHEDEARFKNDPACRFMVSTQGAGGRGNNWTVAGLVTYYNNDDNLEHRLQSEDRNHRDGLTGPRGAGSATYHDLCAQGTIDTKKIRNLRDKLDIATIIQGDDYREWLI